MRKTSAPVHSEQAARATSAAVLERLLNESKAREDALRHERDVYAEAYEHERQATERLRALDEMKNAFLAAVSHELRTPLTSVLGFAETLEQNGENVDPRMQRELVERIAANARKLERLLSDLLDLDRAQRGILGPYRRRVDVGELARRTAEEWMRHNAERHVLIDAPGASADVDPAKVERIIENLLANAGKHTPAGTPIWLSVRSGPEGTTLVVEDAGRGVPDEMKQSIFQPFVRGAWEDRRPHGSGIGLSLVARFAEMHGGSAWVQDREGGGASFRVFLPSAETQPAKASA